jgi:hypothetical protein
MPAPRSDGAARTPDVEGSGRDAATSTTDTLCLQVSAAASAWERVRDFAVAKGWILELMPRGRTRCTKAGSVEYGPGHGACIAAYRDLIDRLGYSYMTACRRGRWA